MGSKHGEPIPCPRNPLLQNSLRGVGSTSRKPAWKPSGLEAEPEAITPTPQEEDAELFSITGVSFIQEKEGCLKRKGAVVCYGGWNGGQVPDRP